LAKQPSPTPSPPFNSKQSKGNTGAAAAAAAKAAAAKAAAAKAAAAKATAAKGSASTAKTGTGKTSTGAAGAGAASAVSAGSATTAVAEAASTEAAGTTTTAAAAATASLVQDLTPVGQATIANPFTSLQLDPAVVSKLFEQDGQETPTAGQVASRTSSNNFINDCLNTPNLPLTNGQQITTGSCNNAPIGVIPSTANIPSSKFANPPNGATIAANTAFNVTLNTANIALGNFVNAEQNYFAAPQQVGSDGRIVGHTHIVIETLSALDQTTVTDPTKFFFFKGVDTAADANGAVSVAVTAGVVPGVYRMCTITSSANHQPVIVAIAQHGSCDDCIYFTATDNGAAAASSGSAAASTGNAAASSGDAADAASTDVATTAAVAGAATATAVTVSGAGKGSAAAAQPQTANQAAAGKVSSSQATASKASTAKGGAANAKSGKGRRSLRL